MSLKTDALSAASGWQGASDDALLAAAVGRDRGAFGALVERYHRDVFRFVWRLSKGSDDAEDMTQEAFMRLWANPAQLREAKALKGWLLRVASNLVMDRYRRKPMDDLEAAGEVADAAPTPEERLDLGGITALIDAAINQLPDRQRQALVLVHFEQVGNIAAAAAMELSVDALESLVARARRKLKDSLGSRGRDLLEKLGAVEMKRNDNPLTDQELDRLLAHASQPPGLSGFTARLNARIAAAQPHHDNVVPFPHNGTARPVSTPPRFRASAFAAMAACFAFGIMLGGSSQFAALFSSQADTTTLVQLDSEQPALVALLGVNPEESI